MLVLILDGIQTLRQPGHDQPLGHQHIHERGDDDHDQPRGTSTTEPAGPRRLRLTAYTLTPPESC